LGAPSVTALAGSDTVSSPARDGSGAKAILVGNGRLAVDSGGTLYSSDGAALRSISTAGTVTTVVNPSTLYNWRALAIDAGGNIYGQGNSATAGLFAVTVHVRKPTGELRTLVENWTAATSTTGLSGGSGIAVDSKGVLYAADPVRHRIVRFSSAGVPIVVAGSGVAGFTDGVGAAGTFNNPTDLAVDASGNVYVADTGNAAVRKITPSGTVSTIALTGNPGPIAVDAAGNVFCMASAPATMVRIRKDLSVISSTRLPSITGAVTGLAADAYGNVYISARTANGGAHIYTVYF
jgi:sugar lactone lactonase YvrE